MRGTFLRIHLFFPHRVICRECELSYILELAPQYMDAWLENEDSRKDFLLSWWDTLECPEQQEILWKAYKTERDRSKRRGEERESLKQAAELCSSSDGFVEFVKECLL